MLPRAGILCSSISREHSGSPTTARPDELSVTRAEISFGKHHNLALGPCGRPRTRVGVLRYCWQSGGAGLSMLRSTGAEHAPS